VTLHAPLNEAQRDALRELANVAAGHAAAALSRQLSGERLVFQPPQARGVSEAELAGWLGGPSAARVAAGGEVRGDVPFALWFVLTLPDAAWLASRLLGELPPGEAEVDAALGPAAQAAAAAALSAVANLTGLGFQPSATQVRRCSAASLAKSLCRAPAVLVLEAHLEAPSFAAEFLLLPGAEALPALLQALRL